MKILTVSIRGTNFEQKIKKRKILPKRADIFHCRDKGRNQVMDTDVGLKVWETYFFKLVAYGVEFKQIPENQSQSKIG